MNSVARAAWDGTRLYRPVLLVVIAMFIAFSVLEPGFRTALNIQNLLASVAIVWIIAMAETFVMVSGGFDLSVGAVVAVCGIFLAKIVHAQVMPTPVAIVLTVLLGFVIGVVFNGVWVAFFRLNVFVVTLASMSVLTGAVLIWTQMASIYTQDSTVMWLGVDSHWGIQGPLYIMAVVFVIFLYLQKRTYYGRDVYAVGGSYTAARLSGIRATRTLWVVYGVAGACAGLASVVAIGRLGAATPEVDASLALNVVAAVLIGGTALGGGVGTVVGTVFGCLFIGLLQNGLNMIGVASPWQFVVTGVILLVSVLGSAKRTRRFHLHLRARHTTESPAASPVAPSATAVESKDS